MLTLEQIAVITSEGGPLLSRFAAAVRKVVAKIEAEPDLTPNHTARLAWAKKVFVERRYNFYALYVVDIAATDASALGEKGDQLADAEIEQIVSDYLLKVVKLTAP